MRQSFTRWLFNLRKASFFATVVFLPIQLSKFFWPEFSFVLGLRVDYLAPSLYLSDFSILAFILSSTLLAVLKNDFSKYGKFSFVLSLFLLAIFASAITAYSGGVAAFKAAKLVEFLLFSFFVSTLSFKKVFASTLFFFAASLLWVSLLSIAQFGKQGSLGLFFLGERTFDLSTPGISQVTHDGTLFLRPYATFPHPNVLAAYITLSLTLIGGSFLFLEFRSIEKWFVITTSALGALALFLTFSRAGWIAGFLGLLFIFLSYFAKKMTGKLPKIKQILAIVTVGAFFGLGAFFLSPLIFERFFSITTSDSHSIILRAKLAQAAISMVKESPIFGVGPGNFLPLLPSFWHISETIRFLQPTHNLFLLVLAELGVFGLLSFSFILIFSLLAIFKREASPFRLILLTLFGQIIFLAFFDHYFWTLQQGLLLFWLFLGLFFSFAFEKGTTSPQ